jgi:hypothetical protein
LKINPKVHFEAQKTTNSQGNTEQKEQNWKYHNPPFICFFFLSIFWLLFIQNLQRGTLKWTKYQNYFANFEM